MFSNEDDIIFDPFAGAGTTAALALKNKRTFSTIELDSYYKNLTERKIEQVLRHGDIIRKSQKKYNNFSIYTKKELETNVQKLSRELGRVPTLEEFIKSYSLDINQIKSLYENPKKVLKASKVELINSAY